MPAPLSPNDILPRGSQQYNELMNQAREIVRTHSLEPINRDAELARTQPMIPEEAARREVLTRFSQRIAVPNDNPEDRQRDAANSFAAVMQQLAGIPFWASRAMTFTNSRSYIIHLCK